jgi:hypothetical protein
MSGSGQYQTVFYNYTTATQSVFISSNYGANWNNTVTQLNLPYAMSLVMSYSGQYQTMSIHPNTIYRSSDYGNNWSSYSFPDSFMINSYNLAMSIDGQIQYMVAFKQYYKSIFLYKSTNYGITWSLANDLLLTQNATTSSIINISTNFNTQYVSIILNYSITSLNNKIYVSSDGGSNFTTITLPNSNVTYINLYRIKMDITGKYQVIGGTRQDVINSKVMYVPYIVVSSDYGVSWPTVLKNTNISHLNATAPIISMDMSMYGNSVMCINSTGASLLTMKTDILVNNNSININGAIINITQPNNQGSLLVSGTTGTGLLSQGTSGQLMVSGGANANPSWLSSGTSGQLLVSNGTNANPTWLTPLPVISAPVMPQTYLANLESNSWINSDSTNGIAVLQICISASGQYQGIATVSSILMSNNYGIRGSWNIITDSLFAGKTFTGIAMSASGQYVTAVSSASGIYASTNYGVLGSWYQLNSNNNIPLNTNSTGIAVSASQQYQAFSSGTGVYISSNYGQNWSFSSATSSAQSWAGISMSGTGQYIFVANSNGSCYASSDYGNTFPQSSINNSCNTGRMSSSGQIQLTVTTGNKLFISYNFGQTWSQITYFNDINVSDCAISSTGQYITVVSYQDIPYFSNDFGNTWIINYNTSGGYNHIAMSANGQYQTMSDGNGQIYISAFNLNLGKINVASIQNLSFTQKSQSTFNGLQGTVSGSFYYKTSDSCKYQVVSYEGKVYLSDNFGQSFPQITNSNLFPTGTNYPYPYDNNLIFINDVAISRNGQYISLAVTDASPYSSSGYTGNSGFGGLFSSSDWGVNFTYAAGGGYTRVGMSKNGKYQTAFLLRFWEPPGGALFKSSSFGATGSWGLVPNVPINNAFSTIAISETGKYQAVVGGKITYSNSNSTSSIDVEYIYYSRISSGSVTRYNTNKRYHTFESTRINYYIITGTFGIYVSSDYGITWTFNSLGNAFGMYSITMSEDGKYIYAGTSVSSYLYKSDNYGASFNSYQTFGWSGGSAITNIIVSSSGQYVLVSTVEGANGYLYASNNYGQSFSYTGQQTTQFGGINVSNYIDCLSMGPNPNKSLNVLISETTSTSVDNGKENITLSLKINCVYIGFNTQTNVPATGTYFISNPNGYNLIPQYLNCLLLAMSSNGLNYYIITNKGLLYNYTCLTPAKTFVIDHPINENKYLVHACLEGPESGVYYRGKGTIVNNEYVDIFLPDYVEALAYEFTIQITPIYKGENKNYILFCSEVECNKFSVYGENGDFYWIVYGKRSDIEVDPNKEDIIVKGNGPYKWF